MNLQGTREGVTPRLNALIDNLQPGSLYSVKVSSFEAFLGDLTPVWLARDKA